MAYPTELLNNNINSVPDARSPLAVGISPAYPIGSSLWIDIDTNTSKWLIQSFPDKAIQETKDVINGLNSSSQLTLTTNNIFTWSFVCNTFYCVYAPLKMVITWYYNGIIQGKEEFKAGTGDINRSVCFNSITIETDEILPEKLQIHARQR